MMSDFGHDHHADGRTWLSRHRPVPREGDRDQQRRDLNHACVHRPDRQQERRTIREQFRALESEIATAEAKAANLSGGVTTYLLNAGMTRGSAYVSPVAAIAPTIAAMSIR